MFRDPPQTGWVRRNGLPLSDRATMTDRAFRHDDLLTHVMMIEDPVCNGVPYSGRATVTEYFDRFPTPDGAEWFVVTTAAEDPAETDASKWSPRPCKPV